MLDEKDGKLPEEVAKTSEEPKTSEEQNSEKEELVEATEDSSEDAHLEEIDDSNAEDAEDTHNEHRHRIPLLDYHSMSMENLVGELQRLVKNEKVQAIKKHVDGIKAEFDLKYQDLYEHKKEDFVAQGGNEVEFKLSSVDKRQFNEVFKEYREKRDQYYKNLELSLKENLEKRLNLIERLKALVNVEEDINTTYNNFKEIQSEWRSTGPIPRSDYNNVWRTYHHHIEIFYDFLNLNRELRDLDFKHNLEEKLKLIEQAEALAKEPNINKAFQELQTLHKIWKEDLGPVDKESREKIWNQFSEATKIIHDRRQDYFKDIEKTYEVNLENKLAIIESIKQIGDAVSKSHKGVQKQIAEVEKLRNDFFAAGKVPLKQNEKTWKLFKEATRHFNHGKNNYYKELKKEQQLNLHKKKELLEIAESLKESEDWDATTKEMKRIQSEWKKVGHVPRKHSDKIWKAFKAACNHYFDKFHASKNKSHKDEEENLKQKEALLKKLKEFKESKDKEKDIEALKEQISLWKNIGRVPYNKKKIDAIFYKKLDALLIQLGFDPQEAEMLKYGDKINQLANSDNEYALQKERNFIRKKIEEVKNDIRQLENNLEFFSNASEDSPVVKDVLKKIKTHKKSLDSWEAKLKSLNILQHQIVKEAEEGEESVGEE